MKMTLGKRETQLFAYTQLSGEQTVRSGEIGRVLGLNGAQESDLLRRLARGGLLARVRPGLYLVPPKLPLGGSWSPDEILALTTLMDDCNGRYQICGPNAFNRYGFDEQIPATLYAYNNRISGKRTIGSVQLVLIKVDDLRLGGTEKINRPDGLVAVYSSRARTLVDAVYDWSRFNSLPRAYRWIRQDLAAGRVSPEELVEMAIRFGDMGTKRRLGRLLENENVDTSTLSMLERNVSCSSAFIPWIPTLPKRGRIDRRWDVVVNGEG